MANPWDDTPAIPDDDKAPWNQAPAVDDSEVPEQPSGNPLWEEVKRAAKFADDLVRMTANGITAGGADNLAANMSGMGLGPGPDTLEGQHAQTAAADENTGMAGNVAEFAGAMAPGMILPGAMTSTLARSVATGVATATGETIGRSYFRDGSMPEASELIPGAILGAIGGAGGYTLGKIFQRPRMRPAEAKDVDLLTKGGVDVYSGQATGNKAQQIAEASSHGAKEAFDNQKIAYSRRALDLAGITAPHGTLDDGVLGNAFKKVGSTFDKLAASNNMSGPIAQPIFGPLVSDMSVVANKYANAIAPQAPIIRNSLKRIAQYAKKGEMTGAQYQQITSELEEAARTNKSLAPFARQMRAHIDKAMEDYIKVANPSDVGYWQMARRQYKNLLVIERATGQVGNSDIAGGLITPKALQSATKAVNGQRIFARTPSDDLVKWGNAGVHILPRVKSVAQNASVDEIVKVLGRRAFMTAMPSLGAIQAGVSPTASMIGGIGAFVAPTAVHMARGLNAMRPVGSLMGNSAVVGGAAGAGIGAAATPALNPFAKAYMENE